MKKHYLPTERHKRVYTMYMSGKSYQEIGDELGVTRQRAQQIFLLAKQRIEQHQKRLPVEQLVLLDDQGKMNGLEPDI